MSDIFISYPRTERARAESIRDELESMAFSVFFDLDGIDGGAEFPEAIDRELRACKSVLACWSPLYFTRRWCLIESRFAFDAKRLVPIAIERFDTDAPPADLRFINYFDLSDWRGEPEHEGWQRTLKSLRRHVGRDEQAKGGPPPQSDRPKQRGPPVSAGTRPACLRVERAWQFSLGGSTFDLFWNDERIAELRNGKTVEVELPPGGGRFQLGMRHATAREMSFTAPLLLSLSSGRTTFIRLKSDANLWGYPSINFWVDTEENPERRGWEGT